MELQHLKQEELQRQIALLDDFRQKLGEELTKYQNSLNDQILRLRNGIKALKQTNDNLQRQWKEANEKIKNRSETDSILLQVIQLLEYKGELINDYLEKQKQFIPK